MSSQGGKREGAGRKSRFGGDKTVAMRVPEPLKPVLENWLDEYRSLRSINHSSIGDIALLGEALKNLSLPLFASRVPAGSPVAADDLKEADIDLNQHLVRKPASTFLVTVKGDSMINAGIHDGDMLVVERNRPTKPGDIVVALVDNEMTVKYLFPLAGPGGWVLKPAHPDYPDILARESLEVIGVVVGMFRQVGR